MSEPRVILITGTSTGIGRAAAEALHAKGHTVIATARKTADIKDLKDQGMTTMALDVTSDASMKKAVKAAVAKHSRVDVLINNAGYGVMLPQEEMPMDAMRAMYEVNVFGLQRMTQLVLPHMRGNPKRKGFGRGRILNVSSAAGHVAIPLMGAYCSTKFAVRSLTWALNGEVRPFAIKAILIEPGAIRTNFGHRSVQETKQLELDTRGPYHVLHRNWDDKRLNANGGHVDIISRRIVRAATGRHPRFHYLAPSDARWAAFAARFLPDSWTQKLISAYLWRNGSN